MSETRNDHVISLIESRPARELSESDLARVRAHCALCPSCQQAFAAAQISVLLLKEGSPEIFEPPPFFQTRVLAALHERQAAAEPWTWNRIWQATGALASSMVGTVAVLAVLTFALPGTQTNTGSVQLPAAGSQYSAEEVILNGTDSGANDLDSQTSDGQVLTTLYATYDDTGK